MTENEAKSYIQGKLDCMNKCDVFDCKGTDECENCNYCYSQGNFGEQKKAFEMAIQSLEEIQQYKGNLKDKNIGKDNMVISSSDLMTILNSDSDSEELKQYKEVGTVEEFKDLKEKNEPKKILYRKQSYGTPWLCPYCEADQIKVEFFSEDGSEPKEKYTFCWQCGTRIDWSE